MRRSKSPGFTLIELLIVMAVAAILLAIAIPAYNGQVRKSRRSDAIAKLQDWKLRQERFRADNPEYGTVVQVPPPANSTFYTYSLPTRTGTTFTLRASAAGAQTGDTGCTVLEVNQTMDPVQTDCFK